jgi:hypothetical protein
MLMIFAVFTGAITITAAPVNFNEVSLWVRARETDRSIVREVSQRKLARALTPQQETTLKSQGASDSLVQSLRSSSVIAAPADVAAAEVKSQPPKMSQPQEMAPDSVADNLEIFNVFRFAGEDIIEPVIVDTVRTYTDVATYIGPLSNGPRIAQPYFRSERLTPYLGGDLKDETYMIGDYISAVSHSVSRAMSIDRRNPVLIKDVPYVLYPIYGVRGVSLYYIASSTNSVKLAVSTSRH